MEVFHMINYTADCYEMKRECVKFAKNLTKNCSKPTQGFVEDMIMESVL